MSIRRVVKNSAWNALYSVASLGAAVAVLPMVLRGVGDADYGAYAFLLGVAALTQLVVGALEIAATNHFSFERASKVRSRRWGRRMTGAGIAASVVGALALLVAPFVLAPADSRKEVYLILALVLGAGEIANGWFLTSRAALAASERFDLLSMSGFMSVLGTLLGALVVSSGRGGIEAFAAFSFAGRVAAGLCAYLFAQRVSPPVGLAPLAPSGEISAALRVARLQGTNNVAHYLAYTSDRLILHGMLGPVEVARYVVAEKPNRFAEIALSIPLSALIPTSARAYAEDDSKVIEDLLGFGSRLYLLAVMPVLLGIVIWMDSLLYHWVGPQYVALHLPARLFVAGLIASSPFKVFSHMMVSKGRLSEIARVNIIYSVTNLGASIVLARSIGLVGVVIPTVFFWVAVYPLTWLYVMPSEGVDRMRFAKETFPVAGAALLGAVLLWAIRPGWSFEAIPLPSLFFGVTSTIAVLACIMAAVAHEDVGRVVESLGSRLRSDG